MRCFKEIIPLARARGTEATRGFTLIEVIVALTIVAMLAALAFPTFAQIRQSARQTRFISDLRGYVAFFQTYQMRYGDWPADAAPGQIPAGMAEEMPPGWSSESPLGGAWQWTSVAGTKSIILNNPAGTIVDFSKIDSKIDDGNSTAGMFRLQGTNWVQAVQ